MEKFISLPVTLASIDGGIRLIPATNVVTVTQASATQVDIYYSSGVAASDKIEITHEALPVYTDEEPEQCRAMRNLIVDTISKALQTSDEYPIYTLSIPKYITMPANASETDVTITAVTLA